MTAFTQLTGTIVSANSSAKPPVAGNAIITLFNNQVQSLDNSTPGTQWRQSAALPQGFTAPGGICGDYNNGVAVYAGNKVAYLTGVGVTGASWNVLPAPFDTKPGGDTIQGISGDLSNGLVVFSGKHVYSMSFTTTPPEWVLLSVAPYPVTAVAGDPTNGILIAVNANTSDDANNANPAGPSSLYLGQGGCLCQWAPLTGAGLPVAKVQISYLVGGIANGFIFYGENQLFSLQVKPASGSGATQTPPVGTQTKLPPVPFAVQAISGDATNGIAAIGGTGDLIASCPDSKSNSWNVVVVEEAPSAS